MERTCVKKPCRYCMAATATATTNAIRRLRPRRCCSVRVRSRPVHSIVITPTNWLESRSRLGLGLGLGLGRARARARVSPQHVSSLYREQGGSPEAAFSGRSCFRLPQASTSLGQSASWAVLAGQAGFVSDMARCSPPSNSVAQAEAYRALKGAPHEPDVLVQHHSDEEVPLLGFSSDHDSGVPRGASARKTRCEMTRSCPPPLRRLGRAWPGALKGRKKTNKGQRVKRAEASHG